MSYIGKKEAIYVAKKMRVDLVHNMAYAEGNTLDWVDTKTVIQDRIAPAGKSIDEIEQILRLNEGWNEVVRQVEQGEFNLNKDNFIKINSIVARNEALKIGDFRDGKVQVGDYIPPGSEQLDAEFKKFSKEWEKEKDIEKKASDIFLDSARTQYFYDGNKRTAQLMMNGLLIENGHSLRSIEKDKVEEYNRKMADFYKSNDKEEMYDFMGKSQVQINLKFKEKDRKKFRAVIDEALGQER